MTSHTTAKPITISRNIRDISLTILACAGVVTLAWSKFASPEIEKQARIIIDTETKPWIDANLKDHEVIIKKLDRIEKLMIMDDAHRKKYLLER